MRALLRLFGLAATATILVASCSSTKILRWAPDAATLDRDAIIAKIHEMRAKRVL